MNSRERSPRKKFGGPPGIRRAEEVQSPTLPLPPPRDDATTQAFLNWVANTPQDNVGAVREAIAAIRERAGVAAALNEQLFQLPCTDASRHLLLLSIIGELREPSSIAALDRFTWSSDEELFATTPPPNGTCSFSNPGMLQSRAAEMLVWVARGQHDHLVLRLIRDHPSRSVRTSAIDAYLFQNGDSAAAKDFLRQQVHPDDLPLIGLPRFGADTDPQTFERLTAAYEAAHPTEVRIPERFRDHRGGSSQAVLGICAAGFISLGLFLAYKAKRATRPERRSPHVH